MLPLRRATTPVALFIGLLAAGCATHDDIIPGDHDVPVSVGGKADSAFEEDAEQTWATIETRCAKPAADEPTLYANEFSWGYTPDTMAAKFVEVYGSGMRLIDRAYWDAERQRLILPTLPGWGGEIHLSRRLVENVTLHIEKALDEGYVEHIFFPDMGHSHLFIPEAHYLENYAAIPVDAFATKYTRMYDDPQLRVLYHTAEQLQTLDANDQVIDDPWIQWRFATRNIVGDNAYKGELTIIEDLTQKANTARDLEGHHYHGAGFNISASEDGCFPYQVDGETRWYDISASDLPYKPSEGGGGDFF